MALQCARDRLEAHLKEALPLSHLTVAITQQAIRRTGALESRSAMRRQPANFHDTTLNTSEQPEQLRLEQHLTTHRHVVAKDTKDVCRSRNARSFINPMRASLRRLERWPRRPAVPHATRTTLSPAAGQAISTITPAVPAVALDPNGPQLAAAPRMLSSPQCTHTLRQRHIHMRYRQPLS
jgi:hypothetical protein